jgi:hypothetical protein
MLTWWAVSGFKRKSPARRKGYKASNTPLKLG